MLPDGPSPLACPYYHLEHWCQKLPIWRKPYHNRGVGLACLPMRIHQEEEVIVFSVLYLLLCNVYFTCPWLASLHLWWSPGLSSHYEADVCECFVCFACFFLLCLRSSQYTLSWFIGCHMADVQSHMMSIAIFCSPPPPPPPPPPWFVVMAFLLMHVQCTVLLRMSSKQCHFH